MCDEESWREREALLRSCVMELAHPSSMNTGIILEFRRIRAVNVDT